MKTNFRNNPEAGLHHLWGRDALDRLRELVVDGDIEDFRVKAMARNMGTLTYIQQIPQQDLHCQDIGENVEEMVQTNLTQSAALRGRDECDVGVESKAVAQPFA